MKRILLSAFLLGALGLNASENNGVFLGLELGLGENKLATKGTDLENRS